MIDLKSVVLENPIPIIETSSPELFNWVKPLDSNGSKSEYVISQKNNHLFKAIFKMGDDANLSDIPQQQPSWDENEPVFLSELVEPLDDNQEISQVPIWLVKNNTQLLQTVVDNFSKPPVTQTKSYVRPSNNFVQQPTWDKNEPTILLSFSVVAEYKV